MDWELRDLLVLLTLAKKYASDKNYHLPLAHS